MTKDWVFFIDADACYIEVQRSAIQKWQSLCFVCVCRYVNLLKNTQPVAWNVDSLWLQRIEIILFAILVYSSWNIVFSELACCIFVQYWFTSQHICRKHCKQTVDICWLLMKVSYGCFVCSQSSMEQNSSWWEAVVEVQNIAAYQ